MRRSRAFAPLGLGLPVMAFAMYARVLLRFDMSHGHFPFYQQYYALASQGKWPWIDYNLEYPPLSIPFIFGPTLFLKGLSPLAVALCRITWALVCTLVVFYGCAVRELQIRKFPVATVVFGFSIVLAKTLYYELFDWAPMCLMLGAYLLSSRRTNGQKWSNALLAVGAFVKFVPILMYPWVNPREPGKAWWRQHIALIALTIAQIAYAMISLSGAMAAVQYHTQRTIDAFGIYGAVALALGKLGVSPEKVEYLSGTASVSGPFSTMLKTLSMAVVLALFGFCWFVYQGARKHRDPEKTREFGWLVGVVAVLAFTFFGKLGQPNYCMWVIACAGILAYRPSISTRDLAIVLSSTCLFCLLSPIQAKEGVVIQFGGDSTRLLAEGFVRFAVGMPIVWVAIRQMKQAGNSDPHPPVAT